MFAHTLLYSVSMRKPASGRNPNEQLFDSLAWEVSIYLRKPIMLQPKILSGIALRLRKNTSGKLVTSGKSRFLVS